MSKPAPQYWTNDTSGVLKAAVEAYLLGGPMTPFAIGAMRAYLRQWMEGDWRGPVDELRAAIDKITDRATLEQWLHDALEWEIDPL